MPRNIFGWDYPPGCHSVPGDEPDPPCEVCGKDPFDCICPECPTCQENGNAKCYEEHGLVRSQAQIDSLMAFEERRQEDLKAEEEYWQSLKEEWEQEDKEQSK